jgi:ABC-type glycerol-3-phosphate transport system substrate-binding protein
MAEFGAQEAAFRAAGSTDTWTVLAFPGERGVLPAYGPSFVVLKSTPERQLASWLFARWMLSPETQARWAGESGYLPVRAAALSLVKPRSLQWRAAVQALPFAVGFPRQADWGRVRYVLGDGFYSLFFLNLPPQQVTDVLAQMNATAAELLAP